MRSVTLPNGLRLLLMERHELPVVSVNVLVAAGSVTDPPDASGLAALTAELCPKGTATRSAGQIAAQLDFIGAELDVDVRYDYVTLAAEMLSRTLAKGVDQLADILVHPTFPEDEVERAMRQRVDALRGAKERPRSVINTFFNAYLFGDDVYGRPIEGDFASVSTLTPGQVAAHYGSFYVPRNTIIAAVGDFDSAAMQALLGEAFGDWEDHPPPTREVASEEPPRGRRIVVVDRPGATETAVLLGGRGFPRTDPDRVPATVVNTVFGDRFTSRLNTRLRIAGGLAYGAQSLLVRRRATGSFVLTTNPATAETGKAVGLILDELRKLHESGITADELASAKAYLAGQFPFRVETTESMASTLTQLAYFGLDAGEIDGYLPAIDHVTVADTSRVIATHFPKDDWVLVLDGDARALRPALTTLALPITEVGPNDSALAVRPAP